VSLLDSAIVRALPAVPKPVVRRLSARYIAGPELDDARRVVAELNAAGKRATVDVLGEEITLADEARVITRAYLDFLDAIDDDGLNANVSVKLTGLGLEVDPALCRENLMAIAERGTFVRIDMEDSSTTDATLELYRDLTDEGYANLGVVLQATLKRTEDDARALAGANVRLCKGIYIEPPEISYRDFDDIRASYVRTLELLLDGGCYVGIATHDEWLVEQGLRAIRERGLEPGAYEFQMLLGVRPELGDRLVRGGHPLRIYVPFGRQWYEYSLRRLQENPKIAGYVAGDLGRSIFRRR
jgi:proline dehydrogenase